MTADARLDLDAETIQRAALVAFAHGMMRRAWEGSGADGGDIQDTALRCGLLVAVTATEPCGESCSCVEYDDFPQTCYRAADWLGAPVEYPHGHP